KSFKGFSTAKRYYDEVHDAGILDLLKPVPVPNEVFIVIQGVHPGVYTKRYELLSKGLGWQGGYVIGAAGTRDQA
ncbi:hypothetical protein BDP27DRAFT_1188220, partial [Rhodocollybia butyracea]